MLDVERVRQDFPILGTLCHGRPLVYLDNAATAQMPLPVQERVLDHYRRSNGNVHRGVHALSRASTQAMEEARQTAADFLGAGRDEVIFTAGTTDALNQLSRMLEGRLGPGTQVIVSRMEHHSNLLPWQQVCLRTGAALKLLPADDRGDPDLEALERLLQKKTALVAVTRVSNVTGGVFPVEEIADLAHQAGALTVVDAAQGMKLGRTDVRALGCDFLAFSGHKLGALTGIGVLYGRRALLETLEPVCYGGGMVRSIRGQTPAWEEIPQCFEAGTPNYVGAVSLGETVRYLEKLGLEDIAQREQKLTEMLVRGLEEMPGIRIAGMPRQRHGAVSFTVEGQHPLDVGMLLDSLGIAVRTGHLCAIPAAAHFGAESLIRVSPAFYNTEEETEFFLQALARVTGMLGGGAG